MEMLNDLEKRTGIKGYLSKDNRYVYLEGGRLRTKAVIEYKDIKTYCELTRTGRLCGTKSFRWR